MDKFRETSTSYMPDGYVLPDNRIHSEQCERNTQKGWTHEICNCTCHVRDATKLSRKPTEIIINDDGTVAIKILCASCIKEDRPVPHHYSFVKVIEWRQYEAFEFYDSVGNPHYHCRKTGVFECTFGHKFQRHNLPYVKCPICGHDVEQQRYIEAEMEVAAPRGGIKVEKKKT